MRYASVQASAMRRWRLRSSFAITMGLGSLVGGCTPAERPTVESSADKVDDGEVSLYMTYVTGCEWTWALAHGGRSWRLDESTQWDENAARTGVVVSLTANGLVCRDDQDGTQARFVLTDPLQTICSQGDVLHPSLPIGVSGGLCVPCG